MSPTPEPPAGRRSTDRPDPSGLPTATWLGSAERPQLGWWHLPADGQARGVVLLVPPLYRDYILAHQAYRVLAERLRADGLAVLRFDLDGAGDSAGGSDDPDRAAAWVASTRAAVEHARAAAPGLTMALLGMRGGATLALHASAAAPADAYVLWDPAASRLFLREQRILLKIGLSESHLPETDGAQLPGFVVAPETAEALGALDQTLPAPPAGTPVLLLTRPDQPPWKALATALAGCAIDTAEATGQPELLNVDPGRSVVPAGPVDAIARWLEGRLPRSARPVTPDVRGTVRMAAPDGEVEESVVRLGPIGLVSVVTESPQIATEGPTVVLLNNSTEHHIGPSRCWVPLARRWAPRGLRVARSDMSGLGDSPNRPGFPGQRAYSPAAFEDVEEIARGLCPEDPGDVVLVGLCSGAYQVMESALALSARGAVMINPVPWIEPAEIDGGKVDPRRQALRTALPGVRRIGNSKALSGLKAALPGWAWELLDRLKIRGSPAAGFRKLVAAGIDVLVVFGEFDAEPYLTRAPRTLRKLARTGRFRLVIVPDLDHAMLSAAPRAAALSVVTDHVLDHFRAGAAPPAGEAARGEAASVHSAPPMRHADAVTGSRDGDAASA